MVCFAGVCLPVFPFLLLLIQPLFNLLPNWLTGPIKSFFSRLVSAIFPGTPVNEEHAKYVSVLKSAEELNKTPLAIVKFGATWCPPCSKVAPTFAALAAEDSWNSAKFFTVDVDESPELATGVTTIPVFAVFRNGAKDAATFVGADATKLRDFVVKAVAGKSQ